jgi:hypothetical protein
VEVQCKPWQEECPLPHQGSFDTMLALTSPINKNICQHFVASLDLMRIFNSHVGLSQNMFNLIDCMFFEKIAITFINAKCSCRSPPLKRDAHGSIEIDNIMSDAASEISIRGNLL